MDRIPYLKSPRCSVDQAHAGDLEASFYYHRFSYSCGLIFINTVQSEIELFEPLEILNNEETETVL